MPRYRLGARFWDGSQLHQRGDVIHLLEGVDPPPLSELVEEPKPVKAEPKPKPKE